MSLMMALGQNTQHYQMTKVTNNYQYKNETQTSSKDDQTYNGHYIL